MANIPPQENWFTHSQRALNVATSNAIFGVCDYTCPPNRCAEITSVWYEEISGSGATLGFCFAGKGATTAPGALPYHTVVLKFESSGTSDYYEKGRPISVRLGPGDQVFIGVLTGASMTQWTAGFSVREIGPASTNLGEWAES